MIDNLRQYWHLWLIFAVLAVITAIVCVKAYKAAKRHNDEVHAFLKEKERRKTLIEKYGEIDETKSDSADPAELFEGAALLLVEKCQAADDANGFFSSLTELQRAIYSFYYFASDVTAGKLSDFFKSSKKPLTDHAVSACRKILPADAVSFVIKVSDCYDEDNESESVLPEVIDKCDIGFSAAVKDIDLFAEGGNYIKSYLRDQNNN